jgi:hypothetical protein
MRRTLVLLFVLQCGPHVAAPPSSQAHETRDDRWSKLDFEGKHSVMTFRVLPNMARTWRDFKKTSEPEMTCRTCHGANAEEVSYRMPNPSLPPIDPKRPPPGPVAAFMKQTMVPRMVELLESPDLGCNTCHTIPIVVKK